MSVLFSNDTGWIISHEQFFDKIAVNTSPENTKSFTKGTLKFLKTDKEETFEVPKTDHNNTYYFRLKTDLFNIWQPFKKGYVVLNDTEIETTTGDVLEDDSNNSNPNSTIIPIAKARKRRERYKKSKSIEFDSNHSQEIKLLQEKSNLLLEKAQEEVPDMFITGSTSDNSQAIKFANEFFEQIGIAHHDNQDKIEFYGQNCTDYGMITEMYKQQFLIPSNTWFHCRDIETIDKYIPKLCQDGLFDLIVMDPPWKNKYIRRRKRKQMEAGYHSLDNDTIKNIPIEHMTSKDALVVVWCTNSKSHQFQLINEIFPKWGVALIEKWFWLKVTKKGEPVTPFSSMESTLKQPFETIIIGRKDSNLSSHSPTRSRNLEPKWVISVPSSINSHKPPLVDVLEDHFKINTKKLKCCELFARSLLPGWTSYGNEVLKLQSVSLYSPV